MSEALVSRRRVLEGAGLAGAAGLVALAPTVAFASPGNEGADAIVGSWQGSVSTNGGPTFSAMTSINVGGTLTSSASIDLQPSNLSTPSYGAWRRTHPGQYDIKFRFFTFDAQSNPAGSGEVNATVTVEGNSLQGSFTLTIFDLAGNVVFSTTGAIQATRIEV
jgi:hypothetical protein